MEYAQPVGEANPNAPYVDRNTPGAIRGSAVPAAAVEAPQREIVTAIQKSGQTPDRTQLDQLWKAMLRVGNHRDRPALGFVSAPVTGDDGARFIIMPNPTGAFAGHPHEIADRVGGVWEFTVPVQGDVVGINDDDYRFDGTQWVLWKGAGDIRGPVNDDDIVRVQSGANRAQVFDVAGANRVFLLPEFDTVQLGDTVRLRANGTPSGFQSARVTPAVADTDVTIFTGGFNEAFCPLIGGGEIIDFVREVTQWVARPVTPTANNINIVTTLSTAYEATSGFAFVPNAVAAGPTPLLFQLVGGVSRVKVPVSGLYAVWGRMHLRSQTEGTVQAATMGIGPTVAGAQAYGVSNFATDQVNAGYVSEHPVLPLRQGTDVGLLAATWGTYPGGTMGGTSGLNIKYLARS